MNARRLVLPVLATIVVVAVCAFGWWAILRTGPELYIDIDQAQIQQRLAARFPQHNCALMMACLDVFSGFICARVAQRDEWRVGGTLAGISALCTLMLSDAGDAAGGELTLLLTACTVACTLLGVKYGREMNQRCAEAVAE